jgi:hypothetical protein
MMFVLIGDGLEMLAMLKVTDLQLVLLYLLIKSDAIIHLFFVELSSMVLFEVLYLAFEFAHCSFVVVFLVP